MTIENIIAHSQYTIKEYYLIKKITKLERMNNLNVNGLLTISQKKRRKI
jgi:hypothetical protein